MPSEDLHKPLEAINTTIARLREDVQSLVGEVKKIPEAIREATNTLRDAIHENIQAQAELKLMEHVMEVRSVKPQIEAENEQIQTERQELDERLESIDQRYRERHQELDETAAERIRDLGAHIFEIDEEQFEAGIEDPFTEQVTTVWRNLEAHNETVKDERQTKVRETTGEVVQSIEDFVVRQESLVDEIQEHRLDIKGFEAESDLELLQIPYYVVEYEKDGVRNRETVIPAKESQGSGKWTTSQLEPVQGASDLLADVPDEPPTNQNSTLTHSTVQKNAEKIGRSSRFGVSFADAVEDALPDSGTIPVSIMEVDE